MDAFDPALHYGPNDAGISALTIAIAIASLIFGSWLLGAVYTYIVGIIQKISKPGE
ncbi:hypothetical protein [Prochlorococcus sp. MIT 1223]|uniref:hypothetical protein n=1 Tax=Prochlorococcus sp. MIT 1223 TaxID=3096217 RepID=UPI002A7561D5|nr:hypothetical protein [Prochlorococcus sp. MIT 1223]